MDLKNNIFNTLHQIFDISQKFQGYDYLQELAKNISIGLNVDYVLIGKLTPEKNAVETIIFIHQNEILDNFTYSLKGTPCDLVGKTQKTCTYLDHVAELFPEDEFFEKFKIRSYTGNALHNDKGEPIGIFSIFNKRPMRDKKNINSVMNFFTARINSEILKFDQQAELKKLNSELKLKNNQLQDLQSMTQTGLWEVDMQSKNFTGCPKLFDLLQIPSDFTVSHDVLMQPFNRVTQKKLYRYYHECRKLKRSFSDVLEFKDINNQTKWIRILGHPLLSDDQKSVLKIVGTFQDITAELKKHKDNIHLKHELKNFVESLSQFLIVGKTNLKGQITYANDKFCEISGYARNELMGKNHRILNSGTHSFDFFFNLWSTIKSGHPWEGIICNKTKDGTLYWVQTFIFPSIDENGVITEYTSIRFDITDKVKLMEELNDEKEKATFASQLAAVGELSAGIAHEIANPLTVISGNLLLLRRKSDDKEKREEIISMIDKNVARIGKIIKGLHHVAQKSRDDSFTLNSLETILHNTLEFSEEALKKSHIEFRMDIPSHEVFLNCNDVKISQIVLNLINNAKDAINDSNKKERWIKVAVHDCEDEIIIKVIDSGPGVPEEHKENIMKNFFTTKKVGKGTGLGLTLVNRFAKEHGATVELTTDGGYTCFQVRFPKNVMDLAI